jgi:hypothetical protein
VELSAQERYDIGLYFAVDGDDTDGDGQLDGDGALFGECSVSTLPEVGSFTRPDGSTGDFVDLDTTCKGGGCPQPEDLCGDIDNANNPIFYDLSSTNNFVTTECIDPDNNGKLNLPSCTSWRQSGANEVCLDPTDAFPGAGVRGPDQRAAGGAPGGEDGDPDHGRRAGGYGAVRRRDHEYGHRPQQQRDSRQLVGRHLRRYHPGAR